MSPWDCCGGDDWSASADKGQDNLAYLFVYVKDDGIPFLVDCAHCGGESCVATVLREGVAGDDEASTLSAQEAIAAVEGW